MTGRLAGRGDTANLLGLRTAGAERGIQISDGLTAPVPSRIQGIPSVEGIQWFTGDQVGSRKNGRHSDEANLSAE
jgi:hypothetical protein